MVLELKKIDSQQVIFLKEELFAFSIFNWLFRLIMMSTKSCL